MAKKKRCQSLILRLAMPWDHFRSIPYVGKPPHAKYCGFWCDLPQRQRGRPHLQQRGRPPSVVGSYSARAAAAEAAAEAGAGIVAEETAEAAGANRTKTHHILHAGVFRHRESNGNGPRAWQALKSNFDNVFFGGTNDFLKYCGTSEDPCIVKA